MAEALSCAVCLETYGAAQFAPMPCCDKATSTIKFCRRCLEIICERASGKVGRCPSCNKHFTMVDGVAAASVAPATARCGICRQDRVIVEPGCCAGCALGRRLLLVYECEVCGGRQRIPHPMFAYQPTPVEFSAETWACQQLCGDYTHWRAVDPNQIPPEHAPEGWGSRDDWIAAVRAQRLAERDAAGPRASVHGFAVRPGQEPAEWRSNRGALPPSPSSSAALTLIIGLLAIGLLAIGLSDPARR